MKKEKKATKSLHLFSVVPFQALWMVQCLFMFLKKKGIQIIFFFFFFLLIFIIVITFINFILQEP